MREYMCAGISVNAYICTDSFWTGEQKAVTRGLSLWGGEACIPHVIPTEYFVFVFTVGAHCFLDFLFKGKNFLIIHLF